MITVNTNTVPALPAEYKQTGDCPHCGAPIYADAACFDGDKVIGLPMPYFTCWCRINLQPQIIPQPYPVPMPQEPQKLIPTWQPFITPTTAPFVPTDPYRGNTWDKGDNVFDDGHRTICGGIDWSQWCGFGSVTQDPNLKYTVIY